MPPRRLLLLGGLAAGCAGTPAESPASPPAPRLASPAGPGALLLRETPLLAPHRTGREPPEARTDLILHWNGWPTPGEAMDLVVHFHGYDPLGPAAPVERRQYPGSGLDRLPPLGGARPRPILALLPKGRPFGGAGFDFPALAAPGGLAALTRHGLERAAGSLGRPVPPSGRLILTAHSGGGRGVLEALAQGTDPDEIFLHDALYRDPAPLIAWAGRRLARGAASGALCVTYIPGSGTARGSLAMARAIPAGLPNWRVLATRVPHGETIIEHGWRLLADPAAALPGTMPAG